MDVLFHMIQKVQRAIRVPQMWIIDKIVHSHCRSCWRCHRTVHQQGRRCPRDHAATGSCDSSSSDHRRGGDSSRGTGLRGARRCQSSTKSETPRHRTQQQAPVDQTRLERVQSLSDRTHASPRVEVAETRIRLTTERVCELEREIPDR